MERLVFCSPVDVEFSVVWEVVADDEGHLLHVQTSAPHVGGDQHSRPARHMGLERAYQGR